MNWVHILLGGGPFRLGDSSLWRARVPSVFLRESTVTGSSCNSCTMLLCPPLHPHCSSVFGPVVG